jgi:hypothetical protein
MGVAIPKSLRFCKRACARRAGNTLSDVGWRAASAAFGCGPRDLSTPPQI